MKKRAFIECKKNLPLNVDMASAGYGFETLDYDVIYINQEELDNVDTGKSIFVGCIESTSKIFKKLNIDYKFNCFPRELFKFRHGNVVKFKDLNQFDFDGKTHFVKPLDIPKGFSSFFIETNDALTSKIERARKNFEWNFSEEDYCLITEKISIISEYRCYIKNGELFYWACYDGKFTINPNHGDVLNFIQEIENKPCAFTLDVAICNDNNHVKTLPLELNDFWSIGQYGLGDMHYAKMLAMRWAEKLKI